MKTVAVFSLLLLRTATGQPGGWCPRSVGCEEPCTEGVGKVVFTECRCPPPGEGFGCGPKPSEQLGPCHSYYYFWIPEAFGPCQVEGGCGKGEKRRKVSCRRCDGQEVEDSYCQSSFTPKPPGSEPCVLLPSQWKHGEWSECSAQECLGHGKVTRKVICEPCSREYPANNYDRCPEETKPAEEENCQRMSYEWEVVPSTCRPGAKREDGCLDGTRNTVCKACDGSVVDRSRCSGSAPVENCVVEVFEWSLSAWTDCRGCPATRSRKPECRSMCPLDGGAGVVGEAHCKGIRPDTETETCPVPGGANAWGRWLGGCSRDSPCETGTERRRCLRKCDQSLVSDRLCPGGEAAATRPCGAPTYKWGAWGTCFGSTCGGDGARTRKCLRVCSDSSLSEVDAGRCRGLGQGSDQERCEYLPSDWQAQPWGPCSAQRCLENGHRERSVKCVPCSGAGSSKKHLDCDPKTKLQTRESCQHIFHEWVVLPQCDVRSTLPSGCKDGVKRTACRRCLSSHNVDDNLCKDKPRPQVACQVDTPKWEWLPYGGCPTSCGTAEEKKEAWCKSVCTGRAVADGQCPQPKPVDLNPRPCESYPGGFEWTPWGSCQKDVNNKCAAGWKWRRCQAKCGVKPIVSSANCRGDERVVCAPLTYSWSQWGPCTGTTACGGTGKKVRQCIRDCDGAKSDPGFCSGSAEERCTYLPSKWVTRSWSPCHDGSGCRSRGIQVRDVYCRPCNDAHPSSQYLDCDKSTRPPSEQSCTYLTYHWDVTSDSPCNGLKKAHICYKGVLDTRCRDCLGNVVSDSHCLDRFGPARNSCIACGLGEACRPGNGPNERRCHKDLRCEEVRRGGWQCNSPPLSSGQRCKLSLGLVLGLCSEENSCTDVRPNGDTYCVPRPIIPVGGLCGSSSGRPGICAPGSSCVEIMRGFEKCEALRAVGVDGMCKDREGRAVAECYRGLYCDSPSGLCRQGAPLRQGQACRLPQDGSFIGYCDRGLNCFRNTCERPRAPVGSIGDMCRDPRNGRIFTECYGDLRCNGGSGRCEPTQPPISEYKTCRTSAGITLGFCRTRSGTRRCPSGAPSFCPRA